MNGLEDEADDRAGSALPVAADSPGAIPSSRSRDEDDDPF